MLCNLTELTAQFWISSTVTTYFLTVSTAVASNGKTGVLMPTQLLWINLIINSLSSFALLTDRPASYGVCPFPRRIPTSTVIIDDWTGNEAPEKLTLLTVDAWKDIAEKVAYHLLVLIVFQYKGQTIFSLKLLPTTAYVDAVTFNMFMWMQILGLFG